MYYILALVCFYQAMPIRTVSPVCGKHGIERGRTNIIILKTTPNSLYSNPLCYVPPIPFISWYIHYMLDL